MTMKDSKIFSEYKLKEFTLKHRLGVAPMTRMSSLSDSVPRQDVLGFLVRRARNGAAMVYTEGIVTDYESAQGYPGQARMLTQRQLNAWRPVVRKIKQEGALAIMQIFHCGRVAWNEVNPAGRIIAPSPIAPAQSNPLTNEPYPLPDEMTQFDIDHVVKGFAETARGAMEAGFDGVEIHGAHGYLVSQFLSSYSNKRADSYGGSPENRFRFAKEVIQAVKQEMPEECLLIFRISNWGIADMEVPLFKTKEEWQLMIKMLSDEAVDAISISTYKFDEPAFGTDDTMARLAKEVTSLPVMICGKIYDRITAEKALLDADIVLSAKSMLLNPNWVADVAANKVLPCYPSEEAEIAYTDEPLP